MSRLSIYDHRIQLCRCSIARPRLTFRSTSLHSSQSKTMPSLAYGADWPQLGNMRIKGGTIVAGGTRIAMAAGASVPKYLHARQQILVCCWNRIDEVRCVSGHIGIQGHLRKRFFPLRRVGIRQRWKKAQPCQKKETSR